MIGRGKAVALLDPWVIDQIQRREQSQSDWRPVVEIPIIQPPPENRPIAPPVSWGEEEDLGERGVAIIDLGF